MQEFLDLTDEYIMKDIFSYKPDKYTSLSIEEFRNKYKKNEVFPNYYLVPDSMYAQVMMVQFGLNYINACFFIDTGPRFITRCDPNYDEFTMIFSDINNNARFCELLGIWIPSDHIDNIIEISLLTANQDSFYGRHLCTLTKNDIKKQLYNHNKLNIINFFKERYPLIASVYDPLTIRIKANKRMDNLKILGSRLTSNSMREKAQSLNIIHTINDDKILHVQFGMVGFPKIK